ncbi:MAG: GNAT family N-acetyltransferase [Ignavibacteria bacterium]|jgi:GNAT superfamily N-acetyltransferase|nr:GNAT family N-acetyltransferase [Ignavibacteria bacterium]
MIKDIEFNNIPIEIINNAKKENISFMLNAKYYAYYFNNAIVGICAIIKNRKTILKSAFVLPEFRGRGIYKEMVDYRINQLEYPKDYPILASAYFKAAKHLIKIGFKVIKNYKKGYLLRKDKL